MTNVAKAYSAFQSDHRYTQPKTYVISHSHCSDLIPLATMYNMQQCTSFQNWQHCCNKLATLYHSTFRPFPCYHIRFVMLLYFHDIFHVLTWIYLNHSLSINVYNKHQVYHTLSTKGNYLVRIPSLAIGDSIISNLEDTFIGINSNSKYAWSTK